MKKLSGNRKEYHEFNGVIGHHAISVFLVRKGSVLSKTSIIHEQRIVFALRMSS